MTLRTIAAGLAAVVLMASSTATFAGGRGFFAVSTPNAQVTGDWYLKTFGLTEVNRLQADRYDIRILAGPDLLVEVIQEKPAGPKAPEGSLGLAKAGVTVDDFDAAVARWREQGVRFYGGGAPRIFYDEALKQHSVQLLDPDGVLVQVFGVSRTAPTG